MSASRGRTYSAACPSPRGNSTRLLMSTLATLGGSWRAETLVGFRKATAYCSTVPAVSMKSVWWASFHWVASATEQNKIVWVMELKIQQGNLLTDLSHKELVPQTNAKHNLPSLPTGFTIKPNCSWAAPAYLCASSFTLHLHPSKSMCQPQYSLFYL